MSLMEPQTKPRTELTRNNGIFGDTELDEGSRELTFSERVKRPTALSSRMRFKYSTRETHFKQ